MDRDGEETPWWDAAIPGAKRPVSSLMIDANHGEEWLLKS